MGSLSSGVSGSHSSHLGSIFLAPVFLINYFIDDATALPISMLLPLCDPHTD